ncbi:MAG: phosphatase PAP2 family protein [Anaerohalosphaeraceae bacterium]|nr:phosphatase PAP2 family protein [Anaerohalosphaeraceae bacterium]
MKNANFSARFICCCAVLFILTAPFAKAAQETASKQPFTLGETLKQLPSKTFDSAATLTKVIDPNILTLPGKLPYRTLGQDLKRLPFQGLEDAKKTYFDNDNLLLLLMAGGGSIALHDRADAKIANNFEHHRSLPKSLDKIGDWLGNPGMHFAGTSIWYLLAAHDKNELSKQRSWVMIRALGVTATTTIILKGINNNRTPNGKRLAWPSGHTSSSFCVAAVLDEFYGPKIGIPAYAAASFVGYRMMDSGDHWASDVLFGAVLGYVVGHSIAGEHRQLELGGFDVVPLTTLNQDSATMGVAIAKDF